MNVRSIQHDEVFDICVGSLLSAANQTLLLHFRFHFLRDWICHENTNFLIFWHLNLQLTQLGMDYFDTRFPSLIPGYQ